MVILDITLWELDFKVLIVLIVSEAYWVSANVLVYQLSHIVLSFSIQNELFLERRLHILPIILEHVSIWIRSWVWIRFGNKLLSLFLVQPISQLFCYHFLNILLTCFIEALKLF